MKTQTIALVGAGLVGFLYLRNKQAAAAKVAGVSAQTKANYYTPTDLAAALGGAVVALTKGIQTPPVTTAVPNPTATAAPTNGAGLFGWNLFGNDTATGPGGSWLPTTYQSSAVANPSVAAYSPTVDSIAAAPVYSLADDYTLNPFQLSAP